MNMKSIKFNNDLVKTITQIIFLVGLIYGLSRIAQAADTFNLSLPF